MFDYELINYLNERNGNLSSKEYLYICDTCPQIKRVKYNSFEDSFEIWTDINYFKFQVYYKED